MIERVELFQTKKDLLILVTLFILLIGFTLSYEYYNYKQLTKFDSALVNARVLKQYHKTKITTKGKIKTYQVLQLKSDQGYKFYTTAKKSFPDVKDHKLTLEIFIDELSFYEYMTSFFAFSKIENISFEHTYKQELETAIAKQHQSQELSQIYQALYLASPLPKSLQSSFSNLGVSHLIAISGFHLGIISALLFFLLKYPYKYCQNRYFPYRNYKKDTFLIITLVLLAYTIFLDTPPSLLRAFVMLVVGFFLYDRGIKIISMQTLALTIMLILALFPRLFFSIGFWLSVSGVFYIFLFLIYFQNRSKTWQFIFMPIFVYIMMLPYSLEIFGNFSLYHPLSIIYTTLFTLFYPISLLLHTLGYGSLLDPLLTALITLDFQAVKIVINPVIFSFFIFLSLGSIFYKYLFYILNIFGLGFVIYALNYVT